MIALLFAERRLELPMPWGRGLDVLGDHRSACATSGVLATRALPLEWAVARVCREAGAREAGAPATHTRMLTRSPDGPLTMPPGASGAIATLSSCERAAPASSSSALRSAAALLLRLLARQRAATVPAHLRPAHGRTSSSHTGNTQKQDRSKPLSSMVGPAQ